MASLIKKTILFLIATVVGYSLLILVWGLLMPEWMQKNMVYKLGNKGHMYTRLQEVKSTNDVDIVFVGSSLCLRGFDPRIFAEHGYKTFNLGSGGQTPVQSKWLIEKYINQLNPKLVVMEVNPYVLSRDGVEASLDLISNHETDLSLFEMPFTVKNIKLFNTLLYSIMRQQLGLNNNYREDPVKGDDTYIHGGYIEKEITYFNKSNFHQEERYDLTPHPVQQEALKQLIEQLHTKNIPVILVQPPVTSTMLKEHRESFRLDAFYSGLGKYYNCNPSPYLKDTLHFFDSRHLNQRGVEIFNEYFIREILPGEMKIRKSS